MLPRLNWTRIRQNPHVHWHALRMSGDSRATIDVSDQGLEEHAMLVLTRKRNESIQIGPEITLSVLEIQGNRVRLGVSAPADVRITRPDPRMGDPQPSTIKPDPTGG